MRAAVVFASLLLAAGLGACGEYESCGPGLDLRGNVCFRRGDAAAAPATDAALMCETPAFGDGGMSCQAPAAGFGVACREHVDCPCGLDLCAKAPGSGCGF